MAAVARFAVFSNCYCCCHSVVGGCAAAVAAVAHSFLFTQTQNVHNVVGPCVVVLVTLTVCVARNLLLVLWQPMMFMMWLQLRNL